MIRLAKSLPKPIYKPKPKVEPVEEVKIDPPSTALNQEKEIELLTSIHETLNKEEPPEEKEAVEVSNFPEVQKVEVLNFPEQKECKHEMKECVHEEVVVNVPDEVTIKDLPLAQGASTSDLQKKTIEALKKVEDTLKKLEFTDKGELKTTSDGKNEAFYGVATAANQLAELETLTSILSDLDNGIDVAVTNTVTVQATDLDIRNLAFATDKVDASGSSVSVSNTVTVQATNLDTRDLAFASDKVDVSGSTITANPSYLITRLDDAGSGITYVGKAAAGTAAASAAWHIFRIDESASPDLTVLFADGVTTFTKIWNDRASYSYS